jgi:hypothetical protein
MVCGGGGGVMLWKEGYRRGWPAGRSDWSGLQAARVIIGGEERLGFCKCLVGKEVHKRLHVQEKKSNRRSIRDIYSLIDSDL